MLTSPPRFLGFRHRYRRRPIVCSGFIIIGAFFALALGADAAAEARNEPILAQEERATSPAADQHPQAKQGKTVVKGRLIYEDSKRPVRRARIALIEANKFQTLRLTTTDSKGDFRFAGLAKGEYLISADAPHLISPRGEEDFTDDVHVHPAG